MIVFPCFLFSRDLSVAFLGFFFLFLFFVLLLFSFFVAASDSGHQPRRQGHAYV